MPGDSAAAQDQALAETKADMTAHKPNDFLAAEELAAMCETTEVRPDGHRWRELASPLRHRSTTAVG